MKRLLVGAGAVALGLALMTATAAAQSRWSVGAGGGGTIPIGNWNNTAVSGWIAYANGVYRMNEVVGIRLDVSYSENKGKSVPSVSGLKYPTVNNTLVLAYLEAHMPSEGKLDVYGGLGGGVSLLKFTGVLTGNETKSTKGAVSALLGLGYPLSGKLDIVGEGRFNTVFNGTFNPSTSKGTNLSELTATLGLRLRF